MATCFPNNLLGAVPPDVMRVFRLLKRLPENYAVRQRLVPDASVPLFWLLRDDGCSALVTVSSASAADAHALIQGALFGQHGPVPGLAEQETLLSLLAGLTAHDHTLPKLLPGLILFPHVPRAELTAALPAPVAGITWGAKEELSPDAFIGWLEPRLGSMLSLEQRDLVRREVVPEVIVLPQLTVRPPLDRNTEASLASYVLSYDQEWVLKNDLDLSDEATEVSDDVRLQLVNGVAGSGKSLVLLYRARLLRQFFPSKRLLVLTHNRPLILDLEQRYLRLTDGDRHVEWRTFIGWCFHRLPVGRGVKLAGARKRREIIQRVWHDQLRNSSISPELLEDEIIWIKDRLITSRSGYLEADRSGRGFGLTAGLRERVYEAIVSYNDELHSCGLVDFGDVPRRVWRAMNEGETFPCYDFVLVDEAQFFAPIWFEIIKRLLHPVHGHLFMVADPTQGFMKRRQSWLASGLNVRGRTRRLDRCYRTTHEILSFATQFYQLRLPNDDEALVTANMQQMPGGERPRIVALSSEQDEVTRVVNEIRALVHAGVPLNQVMVIHTSSDGAKRVQQRLATVLGHTNVAPGRQRTSTQVLRVCSLDTVAGLESPIVFLMGTHKLYESEQSLRFSTEERDERRRDNTRRLYMAMTRAGQRLALTYVGTLPIELQRLAS